MDQAYSQEQYQNSRRAILLTIITSFALFHLSSLRSTSLHTPPMRVLDRMSTLPEPFVSHTDLTQTKPLHPRLSDGNSCTCSLASLHQRKYKRDGRVQREITQTPKIMAQPSRPKTILQTGCIHDLLLLYHSSCPLMHLVSS